MWRLESLGGCDTCLIFALFGWSHEEVPGPGTRALCSSEGAGKVHVARPLPLSWAALRASGGQPLRADLQVQGKGHPIHSYPSSLSARAYTYKWLVGFSVTRHGSWYSLMSDSHRNKFHEFANDIHRYSTVFINVVFIKSTRFPVFTQVLHPPLRQRCGGREQSNTSHFLSVCLASVMDVC